MKFKIYNSFVTLGDPCAETAATAEEAEEIKARMIEEIADMIAKYEFFSAPEELDDDGNPDRHRRTGFACEHAAWDAAHDSVGVGKRLTLEAARIVARAAVSVDGIEQQQRKRCGIINGHI